MELDAPSFSYGLLVVCIFHYELFVKRCFHCHSCLHMPSMSEYKLEHLFCFLVLFIVLQSTRTNQITSTVNQQSKIDTKTKSSSREELLATEREERFKKLTEWKVSSSRCFPKVSQKRGKSCTPPLHSPNSFDVKLSVECIECFDLCEQFPLPPRLILLGGTLTCLFIVQLLSIYLVLCMNYMYVR